MTHHRVGKALAGRGLVLFPAAAYIVHDGRYRLGYGSQSSRVLAAQGHAYLTSFVPWAGLACALGLGLFVARVARAAAGRGGARPERSFAGLWLVSWVGLLAVYSAQEWLEGILAPGHPGGINGIFGHGGSWAVAVSALAALVIAAALRVSDTVVRAVSRPVAGLPVIAAGNPPRPPARVFPARRSPLAGASAGRAPPAPGLAAFA
jgi:hypothetical protein